MDKLSKIAGFSGRLMLGVVIGIGMVSTMEGHRAKLINQQIRDEKVAQNKRYIKELNKSLEHLVYTEKNYDNGVYADRANKYYYTNVYDVYEKMKNKKVGDNGESKAYITVDKNKYNNRQSRVVTSSNILDKNFSGHVSDFYDEKNVRFNQKLKSYTNLKKQAKKMYEAVIKSKDYQWPCTMTNFKKDSWGRNFQYIRDSNNKVKIGYSLPWDSSRKTFITLKLPDISDDFKNTIKEIYNSETSNYILTENGKLFTAGLNTSGQLGMGAASNILKWTDSGLRDIKLIDASTFKNSVYALSKDGNVFVTGENANGQLGLGHQNLVRSWTKTSLSNIDYIIIDGYRGVSAFAVTKSGKLFYTGFFNGEQSNSWVDTGAYNIKDIKIFDNNIYIITKSGELYVTGENDSGSLGLGHSSRVTGWHDTGLRNVIEVENLGFSSARVLKENGKTFVAGSNKNGKLSFVSNNSIIDTWTDIGLANVKDINVREGYNGFSSYVTTKQGALYVAGTNDYLRIGLDNNLNFETDGVDTGLRNIKSLSSFDYGAIALSYDNKMYIAGGPAFYITGEDASFWKEITPAYSVKDYEYWDDSYYILATDGRLYVSGNNTYGKFGLGHNNTVPSLVYSGLSNIVKFKVGGDFAYMIRDDGRLFVAGLNDKGRLGIGSQTYTNRWINSGLSNIGDITHFAKSAFAMTKDKRLFATGWNDHGQLGLGNKTDRSSWTEIVLPDDALTCN